MRRTYSLPFITAPQTICILGLFFIGWLYSQMAFSNKGSVESNASQSQSLERKQQMNLLFRQGFKSYLADDYQAAYKDWGAAANSGHKEALFNIGKMWLDGVVPNKPSNKAKARDYFRQSYEKGYKPAKHFLSLSGKGATVPESKALKSSAKLDDTNQVDRVNFNTWLDNFDDDQWIIQIFASKDIETVKSIITRDRISSRSHILKENIKGVTWYKLIYGQYSSREMAIKGRQKLPDRLNMHKPWLRKVSTLR